MSAPRVERVDARGAALEQAVGEAPRRSADVEADGVRDVDGEAIERGRELETAARHEEWACGDLDRRVVGDGRTGLVDDLTGDSYLARPEGAPRAVHANR